MSTKPKASVHVKPCNIAQSERHNRRDAEYIKSLDPKKLYVRLDLSKHNASYVAPEMEGDIKLPEAYRDQVRVEPAADGDSLSVSLDVRLTHQQAEQLRKALKPSFPAIQIRVQNP